MGVAYMLDRSYRTLLQARLTLVSMLIFVSQFAFAEPPTVQEFRRDLAKIRDHSTNVQGSFRIYRAEIANQLALSETPKAINLPLVRSGKLWRNGLRFRADYKLRSANNSNEFPQSVAVDDSKVFELSYGEARASGMLQIFEKDTPEAVASMASIKSIFYEPLDSLWSLNGVGLADLLQRPDTTIQPNSVLAGGYSLLLTSNDAGKTTYHLEFDPAPGHPFGYGVFVHEEAGIQVNAKRRVFSQEKAGVLYPLRVVDVFTLGAPSEGYTQVVEFDLGPLEANSPISEQIESSSFQGLGDAYQVYITKQGSKVEIAERYGRPAGNDLLRPTSGNWRTGFLWVNAVAIVVLISLYAYYRSKRRPTC